MKKYKTLNELNKDITKAFEKAGFKATLVEGYKANEEAVKAFTDIVKDEEISFEKEFSSLCEGHTIAYKLDKPITYWNIHIAPEKVKTKVLLFSPWSEHNIIFNENGKKIFENSVWDLMDGENITVIPHADYEIYKDIKKSLSEKTNKEYREGIIDTKEAFRAATFGLMNDKNLKDLEKTYDELKLINEFEYVKNKRNYETEKISLTEKNKREIALDVYFDKRYIDLDSNNSELEDFVNTYNFSKVGRDFETSNHRLEKLRRDVWVEAYIGRRFPQIEKLVFNTEEIKKMNTDVQKCVVAVIWTRLQNEKLSVKERCSFEVAFDEVQKVVPGSHVKELLDCVEKEREALDRVDNRGK